MKRLLAIVFIGLVFGGYGQSKKVLQATIIRMKSDSINQTKRNTEMKNVILENDKDINHLKKSITKLRRDYKLTKDSLNLILSKKNIYFLECTIEEKSEECGFDEDEEIPIYCTETNFTYKLKQISSENLIIIEVVHKLEEDGHAIYEDYNFSYFLKMKNEPKKEVDLDEIFIERAADEILSEINEKFNFIDSWPSCDEGGYPEEVSFWEIDYDFNSFQFNSGLQCEDDTWIFYADYPIEEILDYLVISEHDSVFFQENWIYDKVDVIAEFPGGYDKLNEYFSAKLIYPEMARENAVQGKVYVQFVVEKDGSLSNFQIIKGAHKILNKEAIRFVKGMPKWKPGELSRGGVVRSLYTLPIKFKIN